MSKISLDNEYFIFSSHKSGTMSLRKIFNTGHIHELKNANYTKESFTDDVINYKITNNKKLKIITVLREPSKRVISSYFQLHHDREIREFKAGIDNTTIVNTETKLLIKNIENFIKKKKYPKESLYEIMDIFHFNFNDITIKNNYAFYKNNVIELYILDFDSLIGNDKLNYLKKIFKKNFQNNYANRTKDKPYYEKFLHVKNTIGDKYDNFIDNDYVEMINLKKKINDDELFVNK